MRLAGRVTNAKGEDDRLVVLPLRLCPGDREFAMSMSYRNAGIGVIVAIVAAFALLVVCLGGFSMLMQSDMKNRNPSVPIRRTSPTPPSG
jgi:hypothetical protein